MKIAIIYGTTTGNTQEVAELVKGHLGDLADEPVDVTDFDPPSVADYDALLLGIPTWHVGDMQDDWDDAATRFNIPEMKGLKVAMFGCGDQDGYPDTFGDAFGLLWDIIEPAGPELFGLWPTEGYTFDNSAGVRDDKFMGLMCDNDCQPDLTEERVKQWCALLKQELGVEVAQA
ncbi:MAG: flavodoxin [Planctomycetota bacterium]